MNMLFFYRNTLLSYVSGSQTMVRQYLEEKETYFLNILEKTETLSIFDFILCRRVRYVPKPLFRGGGQN